MWLHHRYLVTKVGIWTHVSLSTVYMLILTYQTALFSTFFLFKILIYFYQNDLDVVSSLGMLVKSGF